MHDRRLLSVQVVNCLRDLDHESGRVEWVQRLTALRHEPGQARPAHVAHHVVELAPVVPRAAIGDDMIMIDPGQRPDLLDESLSWHASDPTPAPSSLTATSRGAMSSSRARYTMPSAPPSDLFQQFILPHESREWLGPARVSRRIRRISSISPVESGEAPALRRMGLTREQVADQRHVFRESPLILARRGLSPVLPTFHLDLQQLGEELGSSRLRDAHQVVVDPRPLARPPCPLEARGIAVDPGLRPLPSLMGCSRSDIRPGSLGSRVRLSSGHQRVAGGGIRGSGTYTGSSMAASQRLRIKFNFRSILRWPHPSASAIS